MTRYVRRPLLPLALAGTLLGWAGSAAAAREGGGAFEREVQPLLRAHCYECHGEKKKAGLDFRLLKDEAELRRQRPLAERMWRQLRQSEMPPAGKPQPAPAERQQVVRWFETNVFKLDPRHPDPGRVTVRRLNRAEYNNTIRDLLGVAGDAARDFPADDSGYGFDNIGDVLSLPPVLLEKYLAAARRALGAAIVSEPAKHGPVQSFPAKLLKASGRVGDYRSRRRLLFDTGELASETSVATNGQFLVRIWAANPAARVGAAALEFRLDGRKLMTFSVTASGTDLGRHEVPLNLDAGAHRLGVALGPNASGGEPSQGIAVESLELIGPLGVEPLPESHRRIFLRQPQRGDRASCARAVIGRFASQAYRRPLATGELDRLMALFTQADVVGTSFELSVKTVLQAVLVSPHFLFRGEVQAARARAGTIAAVSEFALASRLSYFLWSSMPDAELFRLAEKGQLRKNLAAQMRRMLMDPKAKALGENFAGQWLQLRNLALAEPDPKLFPQFNDGVRQAMRRETELFFARIVGEDRSILEFLAADYTYVNERLAQLYGLRDVQGDAFRLVSLRGTPRGAPPPPPPPDVPELKVGKELKGTLRQRMEQHRENPLCASCHARMDPIGFGLENFDAIGRWRETDAELPIDPAGRLVSGESFQGPAELRTVLLAAKRSDFVRCLTEKLLTYALGRGLEYYDRPAVDRITDEVARQGYRFSALVSGVVQSTPFQFYRVEPAGSVDR